MARWCWRLLVVAVAAAAAAVGVGGVAPRAGLNLRPIVGVLVQETASDPSFPLSYGQYYLPASYVKWLESAGARVAPVHFNVSLDELEATFRSLNGLLLPGGDYDLPGSSYQAASQFLYELALQANDAGDYFPVWGTCQGFESLAIMTSGNDSILSQGYDSEDLALPLWFTASAPSSRLYGSLSSGALAALANEAVTENLHEQGLDPASYAASPRLQAFYDVLSTNADRGGRLFVSSWEARDYPIYATQFHPERNANEWDALEPIDHSAEGVGAMQELANFFVNEARKSGHSFPTPEAEAAALVYAYPGPLPTSAINRYYVQTYFTS